MRSIFWRSLISAASFEVAVFVILIALVTCVTLLSKIKFKEEVKKPVVPTNVLPVYTEEELRALQEEEEAEEYSKYDYDEEEFDYDEFDDYYDDEN